MAKILLVDDDAETSKIVSALLAKENHIVDVAHTGEKAKQLLTLSGYEVIILDWGLPDIPGVEVLRWYRQNGKARVIMLTGKGTIDDREQGLDCGADDYVIKPFSTRELLARIRALLRRPEDLGSATLSAGGYDLNPAALIVAKSGQEIKLRPREFAVLEFFARHPETVFSSDEVMARVWPSDSEATADSLRTVIKEIRKKLHEDIIQTIAGAGYKLGHGGTP